MSLKRGVFIGFGSSGTAFALQFFSNVVLSHLLLPEEIGVYSVSVAVTTILQALRDFGVGRFLVQEKELTDAKVRTVFGTAILIGWSLAALIFLSRNAVAAFYEKPEIGSILGLLAINFLLLPFGQPAVALMRRERLYGRIAILGLSSSVVTTVVAIVAAAAGVGSAALAYGSIAGSAYNTAAALYQRPDHLLLLPSLSEWRRVWRFGLMVSGTNIIVQMGMTSPDLVIGRLLGFTPVALFSRGIGIAKIFEQFFVASLSGVMGPEYGSLHRAGEKLTDLVCKATSLTTVVGWPFLVFLAFKAHAMIWLLYGEKWLEVVPVLQVLCLSRGIQLIVASAGAIYEGTGSVQLQLRNEIWLQVFSVGFVVLGALHSLMAVVWLRVPFTLLVVAIHLSVFRSYAHIGMGHLARQLAPSLSIAVLFAAVLAPITWFLEPVPATPWEALFIMAIEGTFMGGVYLGLLALHRHPVWTQIISVLQGFMRARSS